MTNPGSSRLQCVLLDSIALVREDTRGAFVVSGSHGGLSAGKLALGHPPAIAAFNDAGVGLDAAGIAGLAWLDVRGVAAFTVAHTSARIGDARSTLETGVVTHANALASARGVRIGERCDAVVARLCEPTTG